VPFIYGPLNIAAARLRRVKRRPKAVPVTNSGRVRADASARLAFQQTTESCDTLWSKGSQQQKLHRCDNHLNRLPLLQRACGNIIIKLEGPNVSSLHKPENPRQSANGPHRLASKARLEVPFPKSLLRPWHLEADQLREDVSRNIMVSNDSRRRRQGNLVVCIRSSNAKLDFQNARPAVIRERGSWLPSSAATRGACSRSSIK
jgi:hypothetical protein